MTVCTGKFSITQRNDEVIAIETSPEYRPHPRFVYIGGPGGFELVHHLQPFSVSEGRASFEDFFQLLVLVLLLHTQILQAL